MASIAVYRPHRAAWRFVSLSSEERWLKRRLTATWFLLTFNVLSYDRTLSLLPLPSSVGKALTQGSLFVVLLLALTLNPRSIVRKNGFMVLLSLLVLGTLLTVPEAEYLRGTTLRTARFAIFIAVLWLLTPYWGRRDLLLPRIHIKVMTWICGDLILGILIDPHRAFGGGGGRLQGIVWPMPSTQTAHYAAILTGMTIVFWFCGIQSGRRTLITASISASLLLLSHTRTALAACVVGLLVAGLSLLVTNPRVRRVFLALVIGSTIAAMTASTAILSWMERGQENNGQLTSLSGRTHFWGPLLAFPRDNFRMIFGFGVSNGQFDGLPVDSNWMLSYQDQGLFGVTVCVIILIFVITTACFEARALNRALCLFLVIYCLISSFTEVSFTGASPYTLDLAVAASMLVPHSGRIIGIHRRLFHTDRIEQA